jgi:membrane-associated phospholipid phosphatase
LHGAYSIIFSYFMIKIDRRLSLVSIPITLGILFSTLYLGQHYLIDLIGGATYALIPCLVAERFQIHLPGTQPKER